MHLFRIVARVGICATRALVVAEPVHRFPLTPSLQQELNVKHGYQLGNASVDWSLGTFLTGLTHDPFANFLLSEAADEIGQYPLLAIFDTALFGKGHSIRPYRWNGTSRARTDERMLADPDSRPEPPIDETPENTFIEIDPRPGANTYSYLNYSAGNGAAAACSSSRSSSSAIRRRPRSIPSCSRSGRGPDPPRR